MQPPMPMQPQPMQQPPAQGAPPPMQGDATEGEQPPQQGGTDPKQVAARLAIAATKAIYEDKAQTDQIVQMLKQGADNPAQAVCDVAIHIMDGLAEKVGGSVPKEVAYTVAPALLGELGELGQHAGAFNWDEQEYKKAMQYIMEKLAPRLGAGGQPGQPQPGQPQQPPPGPAGAAGPGPQAPGGGLLNQEVY